MEIVWRADLACAAFGKISAVYGHIDENRFSVRKCPAQKGDYGQNGQNGRLSVKIQPFRTRFYGQILKKRLVSVNPHHNVQKFTDKSPENAGLSVKCVLLTDKMVKNGRLSVNLVRSRIDWLSSAAFKKAGQKQSRIDRLRSAFRLVNCLFFEL